MRRCPCRCRGQTPFLQFMRTHCVSRLLFLLMKPDGGASRTGAPDVVVRDGRAMADVHVVSPRVVSNPFSDLPLRDCPTQIGAEYTEADKPYNRYRIWRSHLLQECCSMRMRSCFCRGIGIAPWARRYPHSASHILKTRRLHAPGTQIRRKARPDCVIVFNLQRSTMSRINAGQASSNWRKRRNRAGIAPAASMRPSRTMEGVSVLRKTPVGILLFLPDITAGAFAFVRGRTRRCPSFLCYLDCRFASSTCD